MVKCVAGSDDDPTEMITQFYCSFHKPSIIKCFSLFQHSAHMPSSRQLADLSSANQLYTFYPAPDTVSNWLMDYLNDLHGHLVTRPCAMHYVTLREAIIIMQ